MVEIVKEEEERVPNLAGKVFNAFAYVASVAAGGFVADAKIRALNYRQKKGLGIFNEDHAKLDNAIKYLYENGTINTSGEFERNALKQGIAEGAAKSIPSQEKILRDGYRQIVKAWYENPKRNMRNLKDFWTPLQRHNKINVAIDAFTVGGIMLGVLLTIANSKSMSKYLTREDNKQSVSQSR
jgi:hypothetical protein